MNFQTAYNKYLKTRKVQVAILNSFFSDSKQIIKKNLDRKYTRSVGEGPLIHILSKDTKFTN